MSDKVKLIIEIPKETKQIFDKTKSSNLGIVGRAVQNGIPLDSLLVITDLINIEKHGSAIGFLKFLYNAIPPNEMEKYREMYNCRNDKNKC